MKAADEPSIGLCVKLSQTFLGILSGSLVQAQSSMWRVSAGYMRSVTMLCNAQWWPMTLSTMFGVQTWEGIPSKQSHTL